MNVMLPTLFVLSGVASLAVIWRAWTANASAISNLRQQIKSTAFGDIIVLLRDEPEEFDTLFSLRRARQVRHATPKPVTHRLHHYIKARDVA